MRTEVALPTANWPTALADAIEQSTPDTVILVHTEAMKELGERAAKRLHKTVTFEVRPPGDR